MEDIRKHITISQLFAKERLGIIDTSERAQLETWLTKHLNNRMIYEKIRTDLLDEVSSGQLTQQADWLAFTRLVPAAKTKFFVLKKWISIAAAALAVLGVHCYTFN